MKRRQFLRSGLLLGTGLPASQLFGASTITESAPLYIDASYANELLKGVIRNSKIETFIEVFNSLIKQGIDVNATDELGYTLLHHVAEVEKENVEVFKLLVANGGDVNAKNTVGETPLHLTMFLNKNIEIIKFLVSKGANVNAKDNNENTPLHEAALWDGNGKATEFLVSQGADVNAKNIVGETPLHAVAKGCENIKAAEFLISKGVDVNAKDNNGKTPLDLAKELDNTPVVEFLSGVTHRKAENVD